MPNSPTYTGMSFDYNHKNERTFRRGSNLDRQYAYDESSHLIGEYTGNGALIVEYVWLGDRPIAAIYPSNRIVYLVTDHQNKPRRGIDATTQQVVWTWDPDAFGVLPPNASATNGITLNLRFPGQYYDVQTGLYYNHNRYYNPELGRYMEVDPIGLEGGLNPYSYAGNNPVNNVDPSGLDALNLYWLNNSAAIAESTLSRTSTGWLAALAEPSPFGEMAMMAATVGVAAYEGYKYFSTPKEHITPSGLKLELRDIQTDRFIFRGGTSNVQLTPRPVDVGGLSFYLKPPVDQSYTFTTLSAVNATGVLKAVVDGTNHASVFATNQTMMADWINSRSNAAENPHPYTILLKSISIQRKKGELP